MQETDMKLISGLLEKADALGVSVSVDNSSIIVKFSREKKIDPLFVQELKTNKEKLIEYLSAYRNNTGLPGRIMHEGKEYYPTCKNMLYWLDDTDPEFKETLFTIICYRITGPFNVAAFKKAIAWLLRRHESLRATFLKIGDKYYMTINDPGSPKYAVDVIDLRNDFSYRENEPGHLRNFPGHRFDREKGPLSLFRLMHTKDDEYILSIKLHHSIYDEWSFEILQRDVYLAYSAYANGNEPDLPPLQKQLKDCIVDMNLFVDAHLERDRAFWKSIYAENPPVLNIPGAMERDTYISCRPGKEIFFSFPAGLQSALKRMAGENETTLFIIIQSLFTLYISRISKQNDIVMGTLVFGREDFPGTEDQIGYYSKFLFLRTILEDDDSLEEAIRKVKKSNEDTRNHKACPLLDVIAEKVPPKPDMVTSFWKMNIHFSDGHGFFVDDEFFEGSMSEETAQFHVYHAYKPATIPTDIELKIHFYMMSKNDSVGVIYDSDIFTEEAVSKLMLGFFAFAKSHSRKVIA